ncbi:hypothetical protein CSUI_002486 [Cystoisospora suis]|uniref:Uncharacterized protein n=1 Tax=Cystoisospora suis TaxID=483139 RepID=A0A2C6L6A8_9APIC|nr:hypothetical protein CSUI_002486 [Cystoisospora suis]
MVEIYLPKQEGKLLAIGLRGDLQLPDDVRILKDAAKELENAIHHLERSNAELLQEDPNDEVYRCALEENAEALVKKRNRLRRIQEKITALTGGLPGCTTSSALSSDPSSQNSGCVPAAGDSSENHTSSMHDDSGETQRATQSDSRPTGSEAARYALVLGGDRGTGKEQSEEKREAASPLSEEERVEEGAGSHAEDDGSIFL